MRSERGFTLLEVLVAFAIAAAALVVLIRGALEGLRGTRIAGHYEEAVSRARSHLALLGRGSALVAADQQGDDGGGFRWHVMVQPEATAPIEPGEAAGSVERAVLYSVAVTVSWTSDGGDRQVRLYGARVILAPPSSP